MTQVGQTEETGPGFDDLIAGNSDLVTDSVVLTGGNYVRGTALGKITADSKFKQSVAADSDGSEDIVAVLAEDVDASAGDETGVIYINGSFNENKIALGAGHTLAAIKDDLAARGIFLKPAQTA